MWSQGQIHMQLYPWHSQWQLLGTNLMVWLPQSLVVNRRTSHHQSSE